MAKYGDPTGTVSPDVMLASLKEVIPFGFFSSRTRSYLYSFVNSKGESDLKETIEGLYKKGVKAELTYVYMCLYSYQCSMSDEEFYSLALNLDKDVLEYGLEIQDYALDIAERDEDRLPLLLLATVIPKEDLSGVIGKEIGRESHILDAFLQVLNQNVPVDKILHEIAKYGVDFNTLEKDTQDLERNYHKQEEITPTSAIKGISEDFRSID